MFHLIIFVFPGFVLSPGERLRPERWFVWHLVGESSSLRSKSPRGGDLRLSVQHFSAYLMPSSNLIRSFALVCAKMHSQDARTLVIATKHPCW